MTTHGKWLAAESDPRFIYALSAHGVNRFSAHVQGGYNDDGRRTSEEELTAIAGLILAAPQMAGLLLEIDALYESNRPFATLPSAITGEHDPWSIRRKVRALVTEVAACYALAVGSEDERE